MPLLLNKRVNCNQELFLISLPGYLLQYDKSLNMTLIWSRLKCSNEFPNCEDAICVNNLHYFERYVDKSWGQLNHCFNHLKHIKEVLYVYYATP